MKIPLVVKLDTLILFLTIGHPPEWVIGVVQFSLSWRSQVLG
jgi:hypothetical protein